MFERVRREIIYRPDQVVDAARYTVRARFTEIGAPIGHREGFGLFFGGQDLEGDRQRYTYFLVRGDGRFLIKRRDGASTFDMTDGWEESGAVRVPSSESRDVANELAITVDGDRVRFFLQRRVGRRYTGRRSQHARGGRRSGEPQPGGACSGPAGGWVLTSSTAGVDRPEGRLVPSGLTHQKKGWGGGRPTRW